MIGKISTPPGAHVEPLLYYLFGPGRHEEHTDPHIVAGWRHPASLEPPLRPDGKRDFAKLTGLLKQPQAALGERGYPRPVWHCSMRAAPGDRMLADDEWAVIAHAVMHRTGLSPCGQDDEAVRWIAVRHGDDHIHLVAMLARQDGGKPTLSWERYKVRAACLAAEQRYGLRSTAPADRTAARRPARAESEKAARRGLEEAPRITLRRHVTTAAAAAGSEQEFFARLDQAGVLVRKRFSVKIPGQVTGYSVAMPGDTTKDGGPVWYGGGKLAADLSWPKLQQRWTPTRTAPGPAAFQPHRRGPQRGLGPRHPRRRRRHGADPHPGLDRPGCRRRRRLGHLRHPARGRRHARQPHPAPGRRRLRPRRPPTLRPYPATISRREPASPGRPAAIRVRLPDRRPVHGPHRAHHPAGRTRRSRRRTPRNPAARRPSRRSPRRRRTAARRRTPGTARTAAPGPARQHCRPARRAVVSPVSPATSDTRTARSGSRRTTTHTTAATTKATRPHPLTMRARAVQRFRYNCSARMSREARREHLATSGAPVSACPSVTASPPRSRYRRPARSAWQRQSAHGPRLMSRMVVVGREVVRKIRSVALAGAWQHSPAARIRVIAGVSQRPNLPVERVKPTHIYARIGILTHALSTLPTMNASHFPSFW